MNEENEQRKELELDPQEYERLFKRLQVISKLKTVFMLSDDDIMDMKKEQNMINDLLNVDDKWPY